MAKEKVLEKIYYDVEEGFGSVRDLYEKARKIDVGIIYDFRMDEILTQQINKKLQES